MKAFDIAKSIYSSRNERVFLWDTLPLSNTPIFKSHLQGMMPGIQIEEISGQESYLQYFKFSFSEKPRYVEIPVPAPAPAIKTYKTQSP